MVAAVVAQLLPDVLYLTRADWGADTDLPRGGYATDRNGVDIYLRKTDVALHHSVVVDNDPTPEIWETLDEIKAKSRRMQTIRPDLGNDWPYNHGLYLMPDGVICVAEGRGYNRTGAHTKGHNTAGWGLVFMGNFHAGPRVRLDAWVPAINRYLVHVRTTELPNLIVIKSHRRYTQEDNRPYTACPGDDVVMQIQNFSLEDDMEIQELDKQQKAAAVIFAVAAKALAGQPLTQIERDLSIGVIQGMRVQN